MNFFRNPEIIRTLSVYGVLSAAAFLSAYIIERKYCAFILILCIIFITIYLLSTYRRYRRIYELSSDIDRILHGSNHLPFKSYSEGELGVLQSEIYKMTVRLREQQQKLQEDKIYLASSIADISHQIRTPLTSVNLLVSFLSDAAVSDAERRKFSQELYDQLARIDWLITALLKISRLDAGIVQLNRETASFSELLKRAAAPLLIPMELREQTLSVETDGTFSGDISWTCEALTNIVKNCMEHTPNGGEIKIRALENALFSEVVISDNGCGIDKDDLPHIFERFYKGKDSDDRSIGIGLALAKMIITKQNGTVKAENKPDGGAMFTIRFYKGTV